MAFNGLVNARDLLDKNGNQIECRESSWDTLLTGISLLGQQYVSDYMLTLQCVD